MPDNFEEEEMRAFLQEKFASSQCIRILMDKKYGFVEFDTAEEANQAMRTGPFVFEKNNVKRILRVNKSKGNLVKKNLSVNTPFSTFGRNEEKIGMGWWWRE